VPAEAVVRVGDAADEEADAFGADLIAVTAHGRGWLRQMLRAVRGKLLRRSQVPLLVLAPR